MRSGTISLTAECTAHSVLTVPTAQLFSQVGSKESSVFIKSCCPLPRAPVAVAYAYFLKSAAKRLGPTLPLSGRRRVWGGVAESWWWPVHSRGLLDGRSVLNQPVVSCIIPNLGETV
jgi:hypothetical protein